VSKMSLEDRFFPEDGTLLTRYDNFMIRNAGFLGEMYQHCTGKSYVELVKSAYLLSSYGFIVASPIMIPNLVFSLLTYYGSKDPEILSPLEEEIKQEARGYPKKGMKIARIILPIVAITLGRVAYKTFNDDEASILSKTIASSMLLTSIAIIPWSFAEYLSRADMPDPPKKTIFERAKDKMQISLQNPILSKAMQLQNSPQQSL